MGGQRKTKTDRVTVTQRDRGRTLESQRLPAIRTETCRDRETLRRTQEIAPETPNREVRTVLRNWTSSSPSPPSPMMPRPKGPGLRSGNWRRGTQAGRAGWGRRPLGMSEAPARQMELRRGPACWTELGGGPRPPVPIGPGRPRTRPFARAPPTDPNLGPRDAWDGGRA